MISFAVEDIPLFKKKLCLWANQFSIFCFLDSNNISEKYGKYDFIAGIDSLWEYSDLENLPQNEFSFGYIGYPSFKQKASLIEFDSLFFFRPRYVVYLKNNRVYINRNSLEGLEMLEAIQRIELKEEEIRPRLNFIERTPKSEYLNNINKIQSAIRKGQFYELNYCVEFYNEEAKIDPVDTFLGINQLAQTPMSALFKQNEKWILCFSPERLLALRDNKLISQPIKGTSRRNLQDAIRDEIIKQELTQSEKEKAENTMIVDLTRNDLTQYAQTGSIRVEELCQVYTYPFVHQLISTVTAELKYKSDSKAALKELIPAGSMTGAPKIEVMKYIDKIEDFHRGIYAGNIGYWDSDGDFDFNVVIRSLYYDQQTEKISLAVGGAITLLSDPEKEYKECLLKAEGILNFFN